MSQAPSPTSELAPVAPDDGNGDDTGLGDGSDTPSADTSKQSAFVIFVLGEIVALFIYMVAGRSMWFTLDEWDFLAARTGGNLHALFLPHNEHWVTVPILAYRGLWWLFGLRTYRPYQLVIVLLHLAAALLVRTIMRRVGVRPWTATVVASILVFFGSGYQNILLPFQMTLVGSLVFGLVQLLLATRGGGFGRRDALGLAAGCAAIMCSGIGVSMVVAVGIAVLMCRGWRAALLHTVPLAGLYLIWYKTIGYKGYKQSDTKVGDVWHFVRRIVTATFNAMGHYSGLGVVIGVLLVAGLLLAWIPLGWSEFRRQAALPLGLIVGAFVMLCITGVGRAILGNFKETSRYLHLVAAMVLPAIGVAADAFMRRWRRTIPVVVAVLVVGIPGNVDVLVNYTHIPSVTGESTYRRMMVSLPYVPVAKDAPPGLIPEQQFAHFVTIGWLRAGAASGRIPKPHEISPADTAMDTLRLSFRQLRAYALKPGYVCASLRSPLDFSLHTHDHVVIAAPSASARLTPIDVGVGDAYPLHYITVAGPILAAVRPVTFQIASASRRPGQACSTPSVIRAARILTAQTP